MGNVNPLLETTAYVRKVQDDVGCLVSDSLMDHFCTAVLLWKTLENCSFIFFTTDVIFNE